MNGNKCTLVSSTLVLVLSFLLPRSAGFYQVETNDAITRTFSAFVLTEAQLYYPPLGIYSPTSPCPHLTYGWRGEVSHDIYYQNGRHATNFKMGSVKLPTGQPDTVLINGPCPIPGSGPGTPVILTIPDTTIYAPYDSVGIDQLLCAQRNGYVGILPVYCLPDYQFLSLAVLSHCNIDDAIFAPTPDFKNALGNLAGSRAIHCLDSPYDPNDGFKYSVTYYDGTPTGYCWDWFFDINSWGTNWCLIQTEDTTPLGNGLDDTGYLVTCMKIQVLVIDSYKLDVYTMNLASHDYMLVLDLDGTPESWAAALQIHAANNLQGWHDLGGKNGFPCPVGSAPPDKKGDFPIIPTPLSSKKGAEPQEPDCFVLDGNVATAFCDPIATCVQSSVNEVTCSVVNGCEDRNVNVFAVGFGDSATVECNDFVVASAAGPGVDSGTKFAYMDYECIVVGTGGCFDS